MLRSFLEQLYGQRLQGHVLHRTAFYIAHRSSRQIVFVGLFVAFVAIVAGQCKARHGIVARRTWQSAQGLFVAASGLVPVVADERSKFAHEVEIGRRVVAGIFHGSLQIVVGLLPIDRRIERVVAVVAPIGIQAEASRVEVEPQPCVDLRRVNGRQRVGCFAV